MKFLIFIFLLSSFSTLIFSKVEFSNESKIIKITDSKFVKEIHVADYKTAFEVANDVSDEDDRKTILKLVLSHYKLPTEEEILTAAFKLQGDALTIINKSNIPLCQTKLLEEFEAEKLKKDKCYICSLTQNGFEKDSKLFVGKLDSILSPEEIEIEYEGNNDQPFHGAFQKYYHLGHDLNGHTYGSKFKLTSKYDWGELNFTAGTDLYVLSFDDTYNPNWHYYAPGTDKVLQEADEHSYLRLKTKYYLDPKYEKDEDFKTRKFSEFTLAYEVDSDTGIGKFGGANHRKGWHQLTSVRQNYYMDYFKDRKEVKASARLGDEFYKGIGPLGFCAEVSAGINASTTGRVGLEGDAKVSLDSGKLFGGTRTNPLFVVNFGAGFNSPFKDGKDVDRLANPEYGGAFSPRNYRMVSDLKTSYTKVGVETGTKKFRFSIDAVFERNQWSDGDIIYSTSFKYKF